MKLYGEIQEHYQEFDPLVAKGNVRWQHLDPGIHPHMHVQRWSTRTSTIMKLCLAL
jgi:hypothetical protein